VTSASGLKKPGIFLRVLCGSEQRSSNAEAAARRKKRSKDRDAQKRDGEPVRKKIAGIRLPSRILEEVT